MSQPAGAACAWRKAALLVSPLGATGVLVCLTALGAETRAMGATGVGCGIAGSLVALAIEARAMCAPVPVKGSDQKGGGMRFEVALALGFGVLFAGVAFGMLGLILLGLKFSQWSAFGLAFAASAFLLHVAGVVVLGRASKSTQAASSSCRIA